MSVELKVSLLVAFAAVVGSFIYKLELDLIFSSLVSVAGGSFLVAGYLLWSESCEKKVARHDVVERQLDVRGITQINSDTVQSATVNRHDTD